MGSGNSTEKTPDSHIKEPHPGGTRGASMDVGDPNQPEDLKEIWEVLGALPGALAFIKRFLGHIQTLNQANDGLKHSVDAQYSLIQNFFQRKETLIQQPQSSGSRPKKDSKNTKRTSSTELCRDDLNKHENKAIESLQNVIMSQACMISMAVEEVNTTLKSAIPDNHWKSDTKPQHVKQLFYIGDKEGNFKHKIEILNKELKEKQAEIDKLKKSISRSATETKEAGIDCFLLGDLQFFHKNLEEYVSNGRQSNLNTEIHPEDQGETNNDDENVTVLKKQLNNTQENEHLSATDEELFVGVKMKSPWMILQELGKLFDDARNQCDKLFYSDEMETELRDTVVQFHTKFDNILSELKGLEDDLNVRKKSEYSEKEMETEYCAMKTEKEQIEKEFSFMKKRNDDLENQIKELTCRHLEKEKALSDAESQVRDLEQSIAKLSNDRKQALQTYRKTVDEKDNELTDYQNQVSRYKTVINDLEKDINRWNVKHANLSKQQSKTEAALREKTAHISKLEETISGLKLQLDQLETDTYNVKEDLRSSRFEARELRETNDDLRNRKRELSRKYSKLQENLEALEIRMSIVTEERDMLRKKQDEIDAERERQRRRKQANSDIAVVVLHHKEVHALPNQSSERVLTSVEYKALGGIFDMACLSSRGLYPCDMNTHAINGLVDFIKQRNTGADHQ